MASFTELQFFSKDTYGDHLFTPSGWQRIYLEIGGCHYSSEDCGFGAAAYFHEERNELVIAFRGTQTNEIKDILADVLLASAYTPAQFKTALNYYQQMVDLMSKTNPPSITLTGHSLGGALAQLIGAIKGHPTSTFNAAGMDQCINDSTLINAGLTAPRNGEYSNITNYIIDTDLVANSFKPMGKSLYAKGPPVPEFDIALATPHLIPLLKLWHLIKYHGLISHNCLFKFEDYQLKDFSSTTPSTAGKMIRALATLAVPWIRKALYSCRFMDNEFHDLGWAPSMALKKRLCVKQIVCPPQPIIFPKAEDVQIAETPKSVDPPSA